MRLLTPMAVATATLLPIAFATAPTPYSESTGSCEKCYWDSGLDAHIWVANVGLCDNGEEICENNCRDCNDPEHEDHCQSEDEFAGMCAPRCCQQFAAYDPAFMSISEDTPREAMVDYLNAHSDIVRIDRQRALLQIVACGAVLAQLPLDAATLAELPDY